MITHNFNPCICVTVFKFPSHVIDWLIEFSLQSLKACAIVFCTSNASPSFIDHQSFSLWKLLVFLLLFLLLVNYYQVTFCCCVMDVVFLSSLNILIRDGFVCFLKVSLLFPALSLFSVDYSYCLLWSFSFTMETFFQYQVIFGPLFIFNGKTLKTSFHLSVQEEEKIQKDMF